MRWALPGRGKSGGARGIYYYDDARIPLFLLEAYAKNQQADISFAQRTYYRQFVMIATAGLKEKKQ